MVVNLKPFVSLPYNAESVSYTLGISTKSDLVDQKRNVLDLMPGYHTVVKLIPQVVGTTGPFKQMDVWSRGCRLQHETEGFNLVKKYSRNLCEFERLSMNGSTIS